MVFQLLVLLAIQSFSVSVFSQQIGNGFEVTSLLGMNSDSDNTFVEQEGILKKSSVPWRTIINKCEGNIGLRQVPHPLIKSRCCYLDITELGITHNPIATISGSHGFNALTELRSIGNNSNNSMFSFAVAQFQKPKNKKTSNLITCFPVIYENTFKIEINDYFTLFALMKQYANAYPDWSLEYFYIEPTVKLVLSLCDIVTQNGDINNDSRISSIDIVILNKEYVKKNIYNKKFDFNADGTLNDLDLGILRDYLLKKLPCQR